MNEELPTISEFIDGRPYTIGRDGQIRIEDASISRGHAEIRLMNGKLRLRDLGSTNGTYLFIDNTPVEITECYVSPNHHVVLGRKKYTVKALLAKIGIYISYSEDIGLVIKSSNPEEDTITIETDIDAVVSQEIYRLFA